MEVVRIACQTFGCRTNQEEITSLKHELAAAGYLLVDDFKNADIIICNTCVVTGHAETTARRFVSRLKDQYPGTRLVVTGCMAQSDPQALLDAGADLVVGNALKSQLVPMLQANFSGLKSAPLDNNLVNLNHLDIHPLAPHQAGRVRHSVKIQEGCNNRCAYCIVPSVRGPSRSVPVPSILTACENAIAVGYKEIVITGTHIGQYHHESVTLTDLVKRIIMLPGEYRIRLSSLEPADCTNELLELMGTSSRMCQHLHICMQSLCNETLTAMNRLDYTVEEALQKIQKLRKLAPFAGIGTDMITGFPGETESQFQETLTRYQEIGFSYAHLFAYSVRPGTVAAELPHQQSDEIKDSRMRRFRDIIALMRNRFYESCKGLPERIIAESTDPVQGLTGNYIRTVVNTSTALRGDWVNITVSDQDHERMRALPR